MKFSVSLACAAVLAVASTTTSAITITATQDTGVLVSALLSGGNTGILVTGVTFSGQQETPTFGGQPLGTVTSSGTYTNATGTYGIAAGVVLSTGGVTGIAFEGEALFPGYGDGPNTTDSNGYPYGAGFDIGDLPDDAEDPLLGVPATAAQEALLRPITGDQATQTFYDHFDVTELLISFDMQPGFDSVTFNIVFGSEEYPEFVDSPFVDGFGMFLNGVNIAQVDGLPVNIRHPAMTDAITGTELNGILAPGGNPVLTFSGFANPTGNTLRFILADTSDGVWDTVVYFSALAGVPAVPLPPAIWLLGTAVAGLFGRRLLKRREAGSAR